MRQSNRKSLSAVFLAVVTMMSFYVNAQENTNQNKFRQLKQELATPNVYRTGSGAPGHEYWQQRADYDIKVEVDDENQRIKGSETITYYNNSPDQLSYIWIQLDQNRRAKILIPTRFRLVRSLRK